MSRSYLLVGGSLTGPVSECSRTLGSGTARMSWPRLITSATTGSYTEAGVMPPGTMRVNGFLEGVDMMGRGGRGISLDGKASVEEKSRP